MGVPDRWLKYENSARILGTRFIACKIPLREEISCRVHPEKRFTPKDLLEKYPDIKLVIDLTYTTRYYDRAKEFECKGVQHVKIFCEGHMIPSESNFTMFWKVVNEFLEKNPNRGLIVVHCTHGLNRTGYFICRYLVEKMGITPENAFRVFEQSRGHQIERKNYKVDIIRRWSGGEFK